ncbi:hypothetical protein J4710_10010 [Staphylococcus xylosus]|uniref:Uncharacterized protein n=1 Tax=Staphylococcus xylosus TaxID=1288 RepID=A0A939NCB0_STAXY|nr:hypothetical protein [Staphylococcus xylosus]
MVDYADVILPCDSNSLAFHNSPILSLVVIDYLINALAVKETKKNSNRLDDINEILQQIKYHTITKKTSHFKKYNGLFFYVTLNVRVYIYSGKW